MRMSEFSVLCETLKPHNGDEEEKTMKSRADLQQFCNSFKAHAIHAEEAFVGVLNVTGTDARAMRGRGTVVIKQVAKQKENRAPIPNSPAAAQADMAEAVLRQARRLGHLASRAERIKQPKPRWRHLESRMPRSSLR